MSFRTSLMAAFFGGVLACSAQMLDVTFSMSSDRYFPHENVSATITIRNLSNESLYFQPDQGSGKILFKVVDGRQRQLKEIKPIVSEKVVVRPRQTTTLTVDLHKHYAINKVDDFVVQAAVQYRQLEYKSKRLFFQLNDGVEVAKYLSQTPDRSFSFRTMNRNRVPHIALRLRNGKGTVSYGVVDLGRYMKGFTPKLMLDPQDVVHLIHRAAPKLYVHNTFSKSGRHLSVQHFKSFAGQEIGFGERPDGSISVVGAEAMSKNITAKE